MEIRDIFITSSLKYGAYIAVINILINMILYITEANILNPAVSISIGLLLVLIISIFQSSGGKFYCNNVLKDEMSYGYAYIFLLAIGFFASIFGGLFDFIYYSVADTTYLEPMLEEFMVKLENTGNVSELQLAKIYEKTMEVVNPVPIKMALKSSINMMILNAVIVLIVAIFVKKTKKVFEEDVF